MKHRKEIIVCLNASDEITIDSLFKKQKGLRSITSLEFIYSCSSKNFNIYPTLMRMVIWNIIFKANIFICNDNIDVLGTISGKIQSKDIIQNSIKTENDNDTNVISLFILEQISKRLGYKSKSYKIDVL